MGNLEYLFAANAFVWAGVIYYLLNLHKRNQSLRKDLDLLKQMMDKEADR